MVLPMVYIVFLICCCIVLQLVYMVFAWVYKDVSMVFGIHVHADAKDLHGFCMHLHALDLQCFVVVSTIFRVGSGLLWWFVGGEAGHSLTFLLQLRVH